MSGGLKYSIGVQLGGWRIDGHRDPRDGETTIEFHSSQAPGVDFERSFTQSEIEQLETALRSFRELREKGGAS